MNKQQFYDISASFLVPTFNLPDGVNSYYIATQNGTHDHGFISIDVWMVRALRDNPKQSMVSSLVKEEEMYDMELKNTIKENDLKNLKGLEYGKAVFSNLVKMSKDSVYHKKPDEEFLQIAKRNFSTAHLSNYQVDLKNAMYLAGLSYYNEK